jgi:hypothetical protein
MKTLKALARRLLRTRRKLPHHATSIISVIGHRRQQKAKIKKQGPTRIARAFVLFISWPVYREGVMDIKSNTRNSPNPAYNEEFASHGVPPLPYPTFLLAYPTVAYPPLYLLSRWVRLRVPVCGNMVAQSKVHVSLMQQYSPPLSPSQPLPTPGFSISSHCETRRLELHRHF